jgi:hypothetical protein
MGQGVRLTWSSDCSASSHCVTPAACLGSAWPRGPHLQTDTFGAAYTRARLMMVPVLLVLSTRCALQGLPSVPLVPASQTP